MQPSSEVRALFDVADDVDDSCRHSRPFWRGFWGGLTADGRRMDDGWRLTTDFVFVFNRFVASSAVKPCSRRVRVTAS